jgi:hypothetical protein
VRGVGVSSGVDGVICSEKVHEGGGVGENDARTNRAEPGERRPQVGGDPSIGAGGPAPPAAATALPMADVMADMPGVWRRLLAAHVADRLGRCRGCRSDTGSGERWPCSLHRIAAEAQRLHDQKLTRAIDTE